MKTPPRPLTATPAPNVSWRDGNIPLSNTFDDIYFSVDGGHNESKDVFFQGCDLPGAWQGQALFTIGELGFGTGLNFLALLDLWAAHGNAEGRLHFISIESMPLSKEQLIRALSKWPDLKPGAQALIAQWPGPVKGLHRLHFGNATLTLVHDTAETALQNLDVKADAWFLDGFAPAKNTDMWSNAVFEGLAKCSKLGTSIATYTVAGAVRRGLNAAGFFTQKRPGFGRKRERLAGYYARNHEQQSRKNNRAPAPIIIGRGIAGASIARAYLRRGIVPTIIDPDAALSTAASGNPLALVMPRLDLQDRPESRFFLSAYLYALNEYHATNQSGGVILQTGISQHANDDTLAARFEKLLSQAALPYEHMQRLDRSGIRFGCALGIDPKACIAQWSAGAHFIKAEVRQVSRRDQSLKVEGTNARLIAKGSHIHICAGPGVQALADLDVRYTQGQIDWHARAQSPDSMHTYGGYAAPLGDGILLGATHTHVQAGHRPQTTAEHTRANIQGFETKFGITLPKQDWHSRAAIRVTTRDTLPLSLMIKPDVFVMSGLGSRGFVLAPLLAEAQVCEALGEPSPLCLQTQARFAT